MQQVDSHCICAKNISGHTCSCIEIYKYSYLDEKVVSIIAEAE